MVQDIYFKNWLEPNKLYWFKYGGYEYEFMLKRRTLGTKVLTIRVDEHTTWPRDRTYLELVLIGNLGIVSHQAVNDYEAVGLVAKVRYSAYPMEALRQIELSIELISTIWLNKVGLLQEPRLESEINYIEANIQELKNCASIFDKEFNNYSYQYDFKDNHTICTLADSKNIILTIDNSIDHLNFGMVVNKYDGYNLTIEQYKDLDYLSSYGFNHTFNGSIQNLTWNIHDCSIACFRSILTATFSLEQEERKSRGNGRLRIADSLPVDGDIEIILDERLYKNKREEINKMIESIQGTYGVAILFFIKVRTQDKVMGVASYLLTDRWKNYGKEQGENTDDNR